MGEIVRIKTSEVSAGKTSAVAKASVSGKTSGIRVSPNSYFVAVFLATFGAAFFIYLQMDFAGFLAIVVGWLVVPSLLVTDKIIFDGENLSRTGIVPVFWAWVNRQPGKLSVGDIAQVETQALRALKRGGNVFYRYRTSVTGKGLTFTFASGGEDYRRMVRALFFRLNEDALDNRSIELRDYLNEPKETLMKAEFARLPSTEVLENSVSEFEISNRKSKRKKSEKAAPEEDHEKAEYLRQLANELRLAGHLLQALEAFRRALLLKPGDAWLIFEFARCLHSFAGSERNEKLELKAKAALRLAEIRGRRDSELLARLGESYFQYGEWERARRVFQKALDATQESFRSVRGLAEIALREGKIAHVIHHFATAIHFADTKALRNWAEDETEYFSRLNTDEKYMEQEIRRINWLEGILRGKKMALRFALIGFSAILVGLVSNDLIANVGWTVSAVSLLIWVGLIMSGNLLAERSSLVEAED
ncbi:MAG TPA: tetratricopeptide repeat protein [Pyrinomonadaceae bacterium]|nr:tetratricopeptide repeat protein [Pyrinomonadaceae bacterium]